MATISEINALSNYQGNQISGGGFDVGINIDTTPLQRLQQYNYYRDRDLWQQKQVEDAKAADQIAKISAFDINSPLTPFREDLKGQLSEIQNYVRENPDALVYSRNPQKFQDLSERINRFANSRVAATASDAVYNARKTAIEKEVDPRKRQILAKQLQFDIDDLFGSGLESAYTTTLKSVPDLKPEDYAIPSVRVTKYDVIDTLPNSNITTKITFINPNDLLARSEAAVAGVGQATTLDESQPWFKSLPPERQQLEREKASLTGVNRQRIMKATNNFNGALQLIKSQNPDIDLSQGANTGIKIIDDNVSWVNSINSQIDDLNVLVAQGKIKDPTGRVISSPFKKINLNDGLSEAELVMMQSLQQSNTPLYSTDKNIQQTDNAIQQANIGLGYAELNEKRRQFNQGPSGTAAQNIVQGNALNDIELSPNTKPGVYNVAGNKENLANIARLLGSRKGSFGEEVPVLSSSAIKSNDPKKAISYEVIEMDGKPQVSRIMVDGLWYDRGFFQNAQLNMDKEPLKGQKQAYRAEQNIKGEQSPSSSSSTPSDTYSRSELKSAGWTDEQINQAVKAGKIKVN